jgi:hypothetical protein
MLIVNARRFPSWRLRVLALACVLAPALVAGSPLRFAVSLPDAVGDDTGPVTGRLIVMVLRSGEVEPRLALSAASPASTAAEGPALFGVDVEQLRPGTPAMVGARADSHPIELSELPADDYHVQALLIRYSRFDRADGHTIWAPYTDRWTFATNLPGNLYSAPRKVRVDPAAADTIELTLTQTIGELAEPADTEWVKHVRIKSEILSRFWGAPMYIRAHVLLPKDFDRHPQARYPSVYVFGHRPVPFGFNTDPASHERALRSARDGNVETGYEFHQRWSGEGFPRMVAIVLEHPSPYFVESYAVNSANNGPYGDAITREVIPYLERRFRLIAGPYARIVEGASTGGWEALALQLHYPDFFGGAWVFNPDPIDFTRYQLVDIYTDENMFSIPTSPWRRIERPFKRTREGQPVSQTRDLARFEALLGSRGRSGYQLDIWQATHGPVGEDGYPVLLFDKKTGAINRDVARYMRKHGYDLSAHTRENWPALAPRLRGKLNFFAGEMDDFYLNLAVYNYQAMLEEVAGPDYPARFEYGRPKKGHNWHHTDWAGVVREMADHIRRNAPVDADSRQWNY